MWVSVGFVCAPGVFGRAVEGGGDTADLAVATDGINALGWRLCAEDAKGGSGVTPHRAGTIVSPYSVGAVLQMTASGAAGETRGEILRAVGLMDVSQDALVRVAKSAQAAMVFGDGNSSAGQKSRGIFSRKVSGSGSDATPISLKIANGIFTAQVPVRSEYAALCRDAFGAFVGEFESGTVNAWVSDVTHGKIPKVVEDGAPLRPEAILLINAVYFYGAWTKPFEVGKTSPKKFRTAKGAHVTVPFMSRIDKWAYAKTADYQIAALPYGPEESARLFVVLPQEGVQVGALLTRFAKPGAWRTATSSLKKSRGTITIPKFRAQFRHELKDAMRAMGMQKAFSPAAADFSPMQDRGVADANRSARMDNIYVQSIVQQVVFEMDEKGTEAAAATSVAVAAFHKESADQEPFQLTLDRPFLVGLEAGKSGMLIFSGVVNDPSDR